MCLVPGLEASQLSLQGLPASCVVSSMEALRELHFLHGSYRESASEVTEHRFCRICSLRQTEAHQLQGEGCRCHPLVGKGTVLEEHVKPEISWLPFWEVATVPPL